MKTTLSAEAMQALAAQLIPANAATARHYRGETGKRQPVDTVYGGAHLFRADTAQRLGTTALRTLQEFAPDAGSFASAIELPVRLAQTVYTRVIEKLQREPVEDFRLDFEDGYGNRSNREEDGHAESAAGEVASGMKAG